MPKLRETEEEKEVHRFQDWVRGECRRNGLHQKGLADELLISEAALCKRLNGHSQFTVTEVAKICSVFGAYTFGGAG